MVKNEVKKGRKKNIRIKSNKLQNNFGRDFFQR